MRQSPGMPVTLADVEALNRAKIVRHAIQRGKLPHLKSLVLQRDEARAIAAAAVERTGIAVKTPSGKTLANPQGIVSRLRRLEAVALVAVTERYSQAELAALHCQRRKPFDVSSLTRPAVQRDRAGHLVIHLGTEAR